MKIECDIFNREFFRTLTFSLKFQKKAQVSNKFKIQKVDKMEEKRQGNSYLSFRVT
jgi:hypothetical protein